jgi:hypothetical protein
MMSPEQTLLHARNTGRYYDIRERDERSGVRRRVYMANPSERAWQRQCFVLWFDAHAPTYVLAYARGLQDALEIAAGWLAEYMPGCLMPEGNGLLESLRREACEERELPYPPPDGADMEPYWAAFEDAEADLDYTESGYLTSYDWGIALDNPSAAELRDFVKDRS